MKFCPSCGKEITTGNRYCDSCGHDLSTSGDSGSQNPVVKRNNVGIYLLIILGLGIVITGGYFGYKYFMKPGDQLQVVAESTVSADTVATSDSALQTMTDSVAKQENDVAQTTSEPGKSSVRKTNTAGSANIKSPAAEKIPSKLVFTSTNRETPKYKNPQSPTRFTLASETVITRVITDHYNLKNGTTSAGNITISDKGGNKIGTWHCRGMAGHDGTVNGKWVAEPVVTLKPGVYFIQDSEPVTWSKNFFGTGFVEIMGYEK